MSQSQHERGPDPQTADGETSGAAGSAGAPLTVEAQLEQALAQIDEQRQKAESYLDLAQRSQADFVNYKRRTSQELEQKVKDANASLLTQLLPVFDDLQRALENVPDEISEQAWPKGIALIGQKLDHILELQGLQRIGGEGPRGRRVRGPSRLRRGAGRQRLPHRLPPQRARPASGPGGRREGVDQAAGIGRGRIPVGRRGQGAPVGVTPRGEAHH
jgi:molecular chaperone GrpE (heat shock protein)